MVKLGMFEDALETGTTTVVKVAKQTASDLAKSAKGQVAGNSQMSDPASDPGTNEQASSNQMTDDQRKQFLSDLYGKSDKKEKDEDEAINPSVPQNPAQKVLGMTPPDPNANLTPEEQAKLQAFRSQLHGEYYQELTNPPKSPEEPVVEKLEREEQEERWELAEKEKEKPPPLAVSNAQKTERNPGASG